MNTTVTKRLYSVLLLCCSLLGLYVSTVHAKELYPSVMFAMMVLWAGYHLKMELAFKAIKKNKK